VRITSEGYRIIDLASANGTYLENLRIADVTVTAPVVLRLGDSRIALTPDARESEVPASTRDSLGSLQGGSLPMRELYQQLEQLAGSDCSVLVEGETGVGKEVAAESIHEASARAHAPFVVIDCAALAEDLLESELFGHVRGAFTGANCDRRGALEQADRGTAFFDEIGELPLHLQAKLLGALERRRVRPVGSTQWRPIDVRVIAATNRDLAREVNEGRFRADLYYRLAVARVRVPPLRERLEDIPALVDSFLRALRERQGERIPDQLAAVTMARLMTQRWPGNVRELRNTVERGAVLAACEASSESEVASYVRARDELVADFERDYLVRCLAAAGHNVSRAADLAGIQRRHFHRMMRRYRIESARRKA
jgi:DNA-binding NtrC family response regulator